MWVSYQCLPAVRGIMASEKLFNIDDEPTAVREKYGPTQFAQQCLIARRMVEAGVPFVKVARAWWDSHGQNFETHQELCADLDHSMSVLLTDLQERDCSKHPGDHPGRIWPNAEDQPSLGRDHFANAWSTSLSGCGIKGGSVYGKTDADGPTVAEGKIGAGQLFATIFKALGIDHEKEYFIGARPLPISDFGRTPSTKCCLRTVRSVSDHVTRNSTESHSTWPPTPSN
ncbi:MAG: hypothetical protein Ct9H300mP1_29110 [Planctomycetaceae bacterium]|nr:MAG: hypothetical protein Ct9H300mP1_29110 [Planctomycetaceae bacterium]